MTAQWLKLIRQARDESVGVAVVRLAGLAAAAERFEAAQAAALAGAQTHDERSSRAKAGWVVNAARREVSR